jgi:hypothetical protein
MNSYRYMIKEKDKIAKVNRELVTQLTARGTPSLTAVGATDVEPSSGNMMDVDQHGDAVHAPWKRRAR